MRISTIGYSAKQGIKSIGRNKMFSLASIATMSACIFLFGLFFSIIMNFQYIVKNVEEGVAVTIFFDEDISDERIEEIGEELEVREDVSEVIFVSAEEAWETYKEKYFKDNPELAEGFKDDNPLANHANYEVYITEVEKQAAVVKFAESLDGVRKVNKSDVVVNTLENFNVLLGYLSVGIILILLAVSIFLISNTVTMGITVRKEEIAIMKYIGAKDSFVRLPFIVEGVLIGLSGALIPLTFLYFLYGRTVEKIMNKFTALDSILDFLDVTAIYRTLLPVGLALGVGIGFLGSFLTIRKHLRA